MVLQEITGHPYHRIALGLQIPGTKGSSEKGTDPFSVRRNTGKTIGIATCRGVAEGEV